MFTQKCHPLSRRRLGQLLSGTFALSACPGGVPALCSLQGTARTAPWQSCLQTFVLDSTRHDIERHTFLADEESEIPGSYTAGQRCPAS